MTLSPEAVAKLMPANEAVALLAQNGHDPEAARNEVAKFSKFSGRRASAITAQKIEWLWHPWIPLGSLSVLYGEEGLGKGVVAADIAARATLGTLAIEPTCVEWVTFEDAADSVIVPRLMAAGADLDRVTIHDSGENFDSPLTLPDDVAKMTAAMIERGSKLLVIDPLSDALREGLKDNNNADVRRGLVPLQEAARAHGFAVLGLLHPNKGATRAADKLMGSKAWRSVPRSVFLLGRDPADENGESRVLALTKTNAAARRKSLAARIEGVDVTDIGSQPRLVLNGDSNWTDSDLVTFSATGKVPGRERADTKEAQAHEVIVKLLEGHGGKVKARDAYDAGALVGISEETMRRARRALGIDSESHEWFVPNGWTPPIGI